MTDRIPLDDLTSDQLDTLYARIDTLEAVCLSNKRAYAGAVQAAWTAEAERDRYRTAWKSAALRAEARGEGIMRLCDDRDAYKGWMEQEQAYTAHLRTTLAKSEQGRRNLRGLLEHHRDQGSLGILRTTRTRLTRALMACARYRAEIARLTTGQCTHTRAMCDLHHTRPVHGCPYPKCVTARQQEAPPVHLSKGTNAEDCPACKGTNPPYPFLCPGPTTA